MEKEEKGEKWKRKERREKKGKMEGGRRGGDSLTLKTTLSYLLPRHVHIVTFP